MPTFSRLLAPAALLAASLAVTAPASAETAKTLSVEIQYDNSVLTHEAGARNVLQSLTDQAVSACRYIEPVTRAARLDRDCVDDVVARAVARIDHPVLTQVYTDTTQNGVRLLASLK